MKAKEYTCQVCKKTVTVFKTSDGRLWLISHRTDERDDLGRFYQCKGSYTLAGNIK